MFKNSTELINALNKTLPYPHQIEFLDLNDLGVTFQWRYTVFKAKLSGDVDESENGMLIGSNCAILISSMIKGYWMNKLS